MKRPQMKQLAPFITLLMLAAIYLNIDLKLLANSLLHLHPGYFGLALLLFVPQIMVSSLRWYLMVSRIHPLSFTQSVQLVMGSKALNALVPSKLGEMSKAYFLKKEAREEVDTGQCISAVVLEKGLDFGGLCTVLLAGIWLAPEWNEVVWAGALIACGGLLSVALLLFLPLRAFGEKLQARDHRLARVAQLFVSWEEVLDGWKRKKGMLPAILMLSVLIWCLHFLQMYLFFPSLRHPISLAPALAYLPLGILAGLLPFTIGGMGTRDTALIFLFASYADATLMAAVGLLCSMRYWVDTLLGVPFFYRYTRRTEKDSGVVP